MVPNTPSGAAGDAEAIVCRAPQRFAGSEQIGPEVCGHNYEWLKLARNGKDLAADGKTAIDKPTVDNPKGDGDPDAVTCRTPKFVWLGPLVKVCARPTSPGRRSLKKPRQYVSDAKGEVVTPWRQRGCGAGCDIGQNQGGGWSPGSNSFPSQSADMSGGNQTYPGYSPPASP